MSFFYVFLMPKTFRTPDTEFQYNLERDTTVNSPLPKLALYIADDKCFY